SEAGTAPIAVTGMYEPYMGYWTDYLFTRHVGYDSARDAAFSGDFSDPGFLEAAERFQELREKDPFISGFEGIDFTAVQMQFCQGQYVMLLMGSRYGSGFRDSFLEDFQLGVVPFPLLCDGDDDYSCISASTVMVVNKETDYVVAVLAYMKALTSNETLSRRAA